MANLSPLLCIFTRNLTWLYILVSLKYFYAHSSFNNTKYAELTHIIILELTVDAKEVR